MSEFEPYYRALCGRLLNTEPFHTGSWQSIDTSGSPLHETYELEDVTVIFDIPDNVIDLQVTLPRTNLPWAENHFLERVGGEPLNPPPSNQQWPWARHNKRFQEAGEAERPFSHSYPERMWPKRANTRCPSPEECMGTCSGYSHYDHRGIRFDYGDLGDVVQLMLREPLTRQAYLPIWFPEDTGVVHRERVPCTLGYHFMIRNGAMTCRYYMRSCDIVRHFVDDIYMASRLTQWMCRQLNQAHAAPFPGEKERWTPVVPGQLKMYISSLHAFVGDKYLLEKVLGMR